MKKLEFTPIILLFFVALFVALYSATTSPFYANNIYNSDSSIFKIIGEGWCHGMLPYRDLWDSKGPFIFFVNALGYALTKSNIGIFLLQVLNLYVVILLAYNMFCHVWQKNMALIISILFLIGISWNYECGNNVEEYTLIPLTLSCFFFYNWLMDNQKRFKYRYTLLFGITFGICLMSRITNAIYVCFMAMIVAVHLLRLRNFKDLFVHFCIYLFGVATIMIPFLIYFYTHGILSDMWYATFTYNLGYFHASTVNVYSNKVFYILQYLYCGVLLCVSMFYWRIQKKMSVYWSMIAIVTFAYFLLTFGYGHYGMITVPFLAVVFLLVGQFTSSCRKVSLLLQACLVLTSFCVKIHTIHLFKNKAKEKYLTVIQKIPQGDKDKVVLYNCHSNGYLVFDLTPASPFFILQDWAIACNPTLKEKVLESFWQSTPKWIVIEKGDKKCAIYPILKNKYVRVAQNATVDLYKCKMK